MIPLRDNVPRLRPPLVVWGVLALNIGAYMLSVGLPPHVREPFYMLYGAVPMRLLNPQWAAAMGFPQDWHLSALTSMFLHGGLVHLAMNMWVLWVFADNVEDATGHAGFAVFYLLCGLSALGLQLLADPRSTVPVVGASGAIAGVMGAYFVLYPHGKVYTFLPILFIPYFIYLPAPLFLGVWFLIQVFSGLAQGAAGEPGHVAWWAHVGGFVTGALLIRVFRKPDRCLYCYNRSTREYERPGG